MQHHKIKFSEIRGDFGIIDLDFYSNESRQSFINQGHMKQFIFSIQKYADWEFVNDDEVYCLFYTESISSVIPHFTRLPKAVEILNKIRQEYSEMDRCRIF